MALVATTVQGSGAADYKGKYCSGKGDVEYLRLIDRSFEFFRATPNVPNISMFYYPDWDCLVLGPRWDAWWIQNTYGPTFCALPFIKDPWLTFLQRSQDMWFDNQGDGQKRGMEAFSELIGPEGCLCDAARPYGAVYRQGDGNWQMHDWAFEFTAAGVVLQSELLLISRDMDAIKKYISNLERACEFIETRRDPKNNLFLVGPAADLLAPSYGGAKQPDGTFGKAYLTGMSVTYAAALERMVELYKLLGDKDKLAIYEHRFKITQEALPQLLTEDGYFIRSMETDGTKHGVVGQEKYGYFSVAANVDAIAHRKVDIATAKRIYAQIEGEPNLRPHGFLIPNYPSYDDMYDNWGSREHGGILAYGCWVNGGFWATQEARTILAYYRLGKYEDIRKSNLASMKFADDYQMDGPLKDFGATVWFDTEITNFAYDSLGIPAATVRGLFEYVYKHDRLILYPHVPPTISEYSQSEPIRWGTKSITISVVNGGPSVASVKVNGKALPVESKDSISLIYESLPVKARVEIVMEGGWPSVAAPADSGSAIEIPRDKPVGLPEPLRAAYKDLLSRQSDTKDAFEKAYLSEALSAFEAYQQRASMKTSETPEKREAVLKMYEGAAMSLYKGYLKRKSP